MLYFIEHVILGLVVGLLKKAILCIRSNSLAEDIFINVFFLQAKNTLEVIIVLFYQDITPKLVIHTALQLNFAFMKNF